MHSVPLAIFGDLGFQELLLVALASVIIFGRRLPQVAARGYAQFQRVRRTLTQMWRETGIEEELRRVQRELEHAVPRDLDPAALARQQTREIERALGTQPRGTQAGHGPEPASAPPPSAAAPAGGAEGSGAAGESAPEPHSNTPAERPGSGAQSD